MFHNRWDEPEEEAEGECDEFRGILDEESPDKQSTEGDYVYTCYCRPAMEKYATRDKS
jgi:hypothetical protein